MFVFLVRNEIFAGISEFDIRRGEDGHGGEDGCGGEDSCRSWMGGRCISNLAQFREGL